MDVDDGASVGVGVGTSVGVSVAVGLLVSVGVSVGAGVGVGDAVVGRTGEWPGAVSTSLGSKVLIRCITPFSRMISP